MDTKRTSAAAELSVWQRKDPGFHNLKGYIVEELRNDPSSRFSLLPRDITVGYIMRMVSSRNGPRKLIDFGRKTLRCLFCFVLMPGHERRASICSCGGIWGLLYCCAECFNVERNLCLWCKAPAV